MKHANDEIEEKVQQMSENDSRRAPLVSLLLVQFVDRTVEAERRVTEAEFRRLAAALEAQARVEDLRHQAGDAKIQKANEVLDYRLEEMNNFRAQLNQERAEYLRREMYDREQAALSDRVKILEIVRGEQSGKTAAYASMVALAVILVQVVLHFWK
jgi:elongation factor P--beta-lysine ligase